MLKLLRHQRLASQDEGRKAHNEPILPGCHRVRAREGEELAVGQPGGFGGGGSTRAHASRLAFERADGYCLVALRGGGADLVAGRAVVAVRPFHPSSSSLNPLDRSAAVPPRICGGRSV